MGHPAFGLLTPHGGALAPVASTAPHCRARAPWRWLLGLTLVWLTLLSSALPAKTSRDGAVQPADPLVTLADGRRVAPDIARIQRRGELVVAMLGRDTPPFFYQRDGELAGLEVDMARELAQRLGVGIRFDRTARSFNEVIERVSRQQADLGISKLSRTLTRAQTVRFSNPYLTLKHALVLNRLAVARLTQGRSLQSLVRDFDATLGVIADSSFADFAAQNFPRARLRAYPDWQDLVRAVRAGEVVAAYRDEFEVKRLVRGDPESPLTLRTVTLTDLEDSLGIAVGVGDPVLLDVVNLYLAQRARALDVDQVLAAAAHLTGARP